MIIHHIANKGKHSLVEEGKFQIEAYSDSYIPSKNINKNNLLREVEISSVMRARAALADIDYIDSNIRNNQISKFSIDRKTSFIKKEFSNV